MVDWDCVPGYGSDCDDDHQIPANQLMKETIQTGDVKLSNKAIGTIEAVSVKDFRGQKMYSMKIKETGEWYGLGKAEAPAKGTSVTYEYGVNAKGYNEARILARAEPVAVQSASVTGIVGNSSGGRGGSNDQRIAWQAARNSANALVVAWYTNGTGANEFSLEDLIRESDRLTARFYQSTQDLSVGGATPTVAKRAERARDVAEEDNFPDDEIPF